MGVSGKSRTIKKQKYSLEELDLISMSYLNELFPLPKSGELLVEEGTGDKSCTLYYEKNYFQKYLNAFKHIFNSGAFKRTNCEAVWNNLMSKLLSAEDFEPGEIDTFGNYWLTEK